jgi:secretion/DNA translocation related TadE-like protein
MNSDRGSATIWVLAAAGLLALVAAAATLRAAAVLARHRAETAADFAALAAAARLDSADPCAFAAAIATANGAHLERCQPVGATVRIEVSRTLSIPGLGQRRVNAHARAGVLPAS